MKKNIQLLLIIVIASHFAACKSKDKQPQTTIEKIQARWTLESQVENEHISGQDNVTNISGTAADVIEALEIEDRELQSMARRARERTLEQHSSSRRAAELIQLLERSSRTGPDALVAAEA